MIGFENFDLALNLPNAIRGMRNPLASWDKSDSSYGPDGKFVLGEADINLMRRLYKAGPSDRKFLRQIFVSIDITAPLYWWKEMDQYKVATTTDSTSTMHTLCKNKMTVDMFSTEYLDQFERNILDAKIKHYNEHTLKMLKDPNVTPAVKRSLELGVYQSLGSNFNQKRTWTGSLETLDAICHQRKNHKLPEWRSFVNFIEERSILKLIRGE